MEPEINTKIRAILKLFHIEGSNPNVTVRTKDGEFTLTGHLSRLIKEEQDKKAKRAFCIVCNMFIDADTGKRER